jgi:hypothetical protein
LMSRKRFDSVYEDDSGTGFVKLEYFPDGKIVTTIYKSDQDPKVLENY